FFFSRGAAWSFAQKMRSGTGLEMSLVIPGIHSRCDVADVISCLGSRPTLLVSAQEDPYSEDAPEIVSEVKARLSKMGVIDRIEHTRYEGSHALTQERFDRIINWICSCRCLAQD